MFRRAFASLALIALLVLIPHARADPPFIHVYIVAGQSNACGLTTKAGQLPTALRYQGDVLYDEAFESAANNGWLATDHWIALQPTTLASDHHFGPEITLGRALADASAGTGTMPAIVKVTHPSTTLYTYWNPNPLRSTGMPGLGYQELIRRIDVVRERLAVQVANGTISGYQFAGFCWLQGEGDANTKFAPAYQGLLADLVSGVRAHVGEPDLPVVIGRISHQIDPSVVRTTGILRVSKSMGGRFPDDADWVNDGLKRGPINYSVNLQTVRAAQTGYVAGDARSAWVNTDDLRLNDFWHFDAAGQQAIGQRMASALLNLP